MYVRYLMWNFVGRQNDIQGRYDSQDGNWMSGIKFMDELHGFKTTYQKMYYKIRAKRYFLPFLLGLIGLMYHANKDRKVFMYY
jgi:hypothetical protein